MRYMAWGRERRGCHQLNTFCMLVSQTKGKSTQSRCCHFDVLLLAQNSNHDGSNYYPLQYNNVHLDLGVSFHSSFSVSVIYTRKVFISLSAWYLFHNMEIVSE